MLAGAGWGEVMLAGCAEAPAVRPVARVAGAVFQLVAAPDPVPPAPVVPAMAGGWVQGPGAGPGSGRIPGGAGAPAAPGGAPPVATPAPGAPGGGASGGSGGARGSGGSGGSAGGAGGSAGGAGAGPTGSDGGGSPDGDPTGGATADPHGGSPDPNGAAPDPDGAKPDPTPSAPPADGPSIAPTPAGPLPEPPEPPAGPPATRHGEVRAALAGGPGAPIAGARVVAFGAGGPVEAIADAEGRFAIASPAGAGDVLVTAPGHAPCLVAGWTGGPLALHLVGAEVPLPADDDFVPVRGVVTDAAGQPVAGATVIGSDGARAAVGPFTTDAQGRFAGLARTDRRAGAVAVFAYTTDASGRAQAAGVARPVALGQGLAEVAIALAPAAGWVGRPQPAPVAGATATGAALALRAPEGAAVLARRWEAATDLGDGPFFALPGVAVEASAGVASADGTRRSYWRATLEGGGTPGPTLLAFPAPPRATGLVPGATLAWHPVPGATAYRVTLRRRGANLPTWEAYTPDPAVRLRGLPAEPADELELVALAGAGSAVYEVAAAGARPQPPARLRLAEHLARVERWSTVVVDLGPPAGRGSQGPQGPGGKP